MLIGIISLREKKLSNIKFEFQLQQQTNQTKTEHNVNV